LTTGAKQIGLFTADIFGLEKLMRTIPLNTGRQIDRARVAKRAIFATRKSLNSQVVRNIKSPFSNPRAITAKLCGHSHLPASKITPSANSMGCCLLTLR
jgi:hypothetical protein